MFNVLVSISVCDLCTRSQHYRLYCRVFFRVFSCVFFRVFFSLFPCLFPLFLCLFPCLCVFSVPVETPNGGGNVVIKKRSSARDDSHLSHLFRSSQVISQCDDASPAPVPPPQPVPRRSRLTDASLLCVRCCRNSSNHEQGLRRSRLLPALHADRLRRRLCWRR